LFSKIIKRRADTNNEVRRKTKKDMTPQKKPEKRSREDRGEWIKGSNLCGKGK